MPQLPEGMMGEPVREIELHHHYDDLQPVPNAPYKLRFENGTVLEGVLGSDGHKLLSGVPAGAYTVEFGEDGRDWQPPPLESRAADCFRASVQTEGRQAIEHMLASTPASKGDVA